MYESREEILKRSDAFQQTTRVVLDSEVEIRGFFQAHGGDVVLVACGSSYWASLSAHKTLKLALRRSVYAVKAGDVLMNPEEHARAYTDPVLVVPSRSGSTTEQLEAIRIFRESYGTVPVLSIVVYDNTPLESLSDLCLSIPWANEVSVCQTRSFSCLYLALILIAGLYDDALKQGMLRFLEVSEFLAQRDFPKVEALVSHSTSQPRLIAIGSGRQYGVTIEGAYICVEMAQLPASYYTVTELRHGPVVTVNEHTVVVVCSMGTPLAIEEQMAREAKAQGAYILAVVSEGSFSGADTLFSLDGPYPPEAVALHYVFVMQAYAHFMAIARGLDPDRPGNLVRFIQLKA